MSKFAIALAMVVSATASLSASADPGNFFANGSVGQAAYRIPSLSYASNDFEHYSIDKKDLAGALRFGYVWHSAIDYGVEVGYVDLGNGTTTDRVHIGSLNGGFQDKLKSRGWLIGGNLKYNFAQKWFVSARGGWYRSRMESEITARGENFCVGFDEGCHKHGTYGTTGTGEYVGLGVGYNILPQLSVGLNYDNYHSRPAYSHEYNDFNTAMYSLSAEYRF